jgi:hypothetical protein
MNEEIEDLIDDIAKAPSFMGGNKKYACQTDSEEVFMKDIIEVKDYINDLHRRLRSEGDYSQLEELYNDYKEENEALKKENQELKIYVVVKEKLRIYLNDDLIVGAILSIVNNTINKLSKEQYEKVKKALEEEE